MAQKSKKLGRTRKSDRIPKYNSPKRRLLNSYLLDTPEYKKCLKKGLPFFSKSELNKLQKKYNKGITWKEIETELSKKGMIFKKATFRKYIRERNFPPSERYRTYEKGREALYPKEAIEHINFVQYLYRMADDEQISWLLNLIDELTLNGVDAVESKLHMTGNIFTAFKDYISDSVYAGEALDEVIHDVFQKTPDFAEELTQDLEDLYNNFWEQYSRFIEKLKTYKMSGTSLKETEDQNE